MRVRRFLLRVLIATIAGILIGVAFGLLMTELHRVASLRSLLFAAVMAPPLVTLVHEGGHLLAGRAVGMAPVLVVAGPIGFAWRVGQRWPAAWARPHYSGGFTLSVPPPDRGGMRAREIATLAGGPLASLALALAAAAFWFSTDNPLRGPVALGGVVSAIAFVWTVIPYTDKGITSDGGKISMLLRNGPEARALCAGLALAGVAWRGEPPARWPREAMEIALAADPGSPEHISARHLAFYVALDTGDEAGAEDIIGALAEAVEGMAGAIAGPVIWDAAAFALFVRGDAETARALIEGRKSGQFHDVHLEHLVRAGLAAADGDREKAMILARKARAGLGRALFPGWATLHERWLARLEAELAAPPPGTAA